MRSPLSAHPTSMAPMLSLCNGNSPCTPSTRSSAGAALNTTASFTVSGAALKCSPVFHPQPPFISVYPIEFPASDLMMVLQRAHSLFSGSVIVQCALHGQDRTTSNTVVPKYPLALEEVCWCQKWFGFVHLDDSCLYLNSPAVAPEFNFVPPPPVKWMNHWQQDSFVFSSFSCHP